MLTLACIGLVAAHVTPVTLPAPRKLVSYRKIGGMRFVRLGKVSLSFCLTNKPIA